MWSCPTCEQEYDSSVIEQLVIDAVQRCSMEYNVQDLMCSKCSGVKQSNMRYYCECAAGKFRGTIGEKDFWEKMKTFTNVAK